MLRDTQVIEEQLLVVRCRLGERSAMEELVRRWERPLLFYVRRMLPADDDAFQVMQDVWVKVFSGLGSLRDAARLGPWLYALTRNALMDLLRERYARQQWLAPVGDGDRDSVEPAVEDGGTDWFVAAEGSALRVVPRVRRGSRGPDTLLP